MLAEVGEGDASFSHPTTSVMITPAENKLGTPEVLPYPLPFVVRRFNDSEYLLLGSSDLMGKTVQAFFDDAKAIAKQSWNLDLAAVVEELDGLYIPVKQSSEWSKRVAALQSRDGLVVLGDAVSGAGFAEICRFVQQQLSVNFP